MNSLDGLATAAATGDGDAVGVWANAEGQWVGENVAALMANPPLSDYVTNILALLQAVADGSEQTEAVTALLTMKNEIAEAFALPTTAEATPAPTAKPATPKPVSYAKVSQRTWAKIVKSPDNYIGRGFQIWACIWQFDGATGPASFLAQSSFRREEFWFSDGENSSFNGPVGRLDDFVENDVVFMNVIGTGSYSYDTQAGGNTTVPSFDVKKISRKGSCD